MRRVALIVVLLLAGCAEPGAARRDVVVVRVSAGASGAEQPPVASRLTPGAAPSCSGDLGRPPKSLGVTKAPPPPAGVGSGPRSSAGVGNMPQPSVAAGNVPRASVGVEGSPSASWDVDDARERARRALESQRQPIPRRGVVPEAAVPGAEGCVYLLRMTLTLLTAGSTRPPEARAVEEQLRSAGLKGIVMRPGPSFGASTGAACIYGTFTASGPSFEIGPPVTPCA